jgi:putative transposase
LGLQEAKDNSEIWNIAQHQGLLKQYQLVGSMSRKGNCWDNALTERFFLNLKRERV